MGIFKGNTGVASSAVLAKANVNESEIMEIVDTKHFYMTRIVLGIMIFLNGISHYIGAFVTGHFDKNGPECNPKWTDGRCNMDYTFARQYGFVMFVLLCASGLAMTATTLMGSGVWNKVFWSPAKVAIVLSPIFFGVYATILICGITLNLTGMFPIGMLDFVQMRDFFGDEKRPLGIWFIFPQTIIEGWYTIYMCAAMGARLNKLPAKLAMYGFKITGVDSFGNITEINGTLYP